MASVSILIRSTGRQAALAATMASVRGQTHKDYEIIIVEDGQATLYGFLERYKDLPVETPLYYHPLLERKNRSAASNQGMMAAQKTYCIILDEGDELYPDHLALLLARIAEAKCKIAFCWTEERTVTRAPNGAIIKRGRRPRWRRENFSLLHLIAGDFMPLSSLLFHRSLFEQAGGFDPELHAYQDWLFLLRIAAVEPQWECLRKATSIHHVPFRKDRKKPVAKTYNRMEKLEAHMAKLPIAWPMLALHQEMKRHFGAAMFLRKWYYFLSGYIR